ncbi:hypothetical protein DFH09DRAFT_1073241 [Mycena vulgaris]|nr:hypothetical protein DFH09DRAFT_1073241 [Mycena vulgaris]
MTFQALFGGAQKRCPRKPSVRVMEEILMEALADVAEDESPDDARGIWPVKPGQEADVGAVWKNHLGSSKLSAISNGNSLTSYCVCDESAEVIDPKDPHGRCKVDGCETKWYHLSCMKLDWAPDGWACDPCIHWGRLVEGYDGVEGNNWIQQCAQSSGKIKMEKSVEERL